MHECLSAISQKHDLRLLGNLHAKVLVAPGRAALVGSMNPTRNGLEKLEEVSTTLDRPEDLARLQAVFERWWALATPFSDALRVAPKESAVASACRRTHEAGACTVARSRLFEDEAVLTATSPSAKVIR